MEQQNNSTAVAEIHENTDFMLGLNELKARANMVTEIKRQIMKNGTHFGVIPGCGDKPTLLKNGAELLCMAFKLAPEAKVEIADLGNGHREYTVTTTLVSIATGTPIATGLGSCSTMESKYRYRNVSDFELTGQPIPADAKERKQEYRRQGYGMKKVDGAWEWVRFKDSAKAENPDIADQYNTVLKMASKRSLVDATLKATGGSCEFTQDIEDMATQVGYADYQDMCDEQPEPPRATAQPAAPKAVTLAQKDANWQKACAAQRDRSPEVFDNFLKAHNVKSVANIKDSASRKKFLDDVKATIDNALQGDENGEADNG